MTICIGRREDSILSRNVVGDGKLLKVCMMMIWDADLPSPPAGVWAMSRGT